MYAGLGNGGGLLLEADIEVDRLMLWSKSEKRCLCSHYSELIGTIKWLDAD